MINNAKVLLGALLVLVIFLLMSEAAIRLLRLSPVLLDREVSAINQNWREVGGFRENFIRNSLGLRGKKEIPPKTKGAYRVLCVGDSWTFGLNVAEEKSYPAFLGEFLKRNRPEINFEVINAGVSGNRLEEMRLFLEKNLRALDPDCIILLGGENGVLADPRDHEKPYRDFYSSGIGKVLARSHAFSALSRVIKKMEDNFPASPWAIIRVGSKDDLEVNLEVKLIAGFLDKLHFEGRAILLMNYPLPKRTERVLYHKVQESYYSNEDIMLKVLSKMHSKPRFINLYDLMKDFPECNELFLNMYYTHPNEKGYKVMAELAGECVLKEMDSRNGKNGF